MLTPAVAIKWSLEQVVDRREVQKKQLISSCESGRINQWSNVKWSAPATGGLKPNVDAFVYAGASSFSIGIILKE